MLFRSLNTEFAALITAFGESGEPYLNWLVKTLWPVNRGAKCLRTIERIMCEARVYGGYMIFATYERLSPECKVAMKLFVQARLDMLKSIPLAALYNDTCPTIPLSGATVLQRAQLVDVYEGVLNVIETLCDTDFMCIVDSKTAANRHVVIQALFWYVGERIRGLENLALVDELSLPAAAHSTFSALFEALCIILSREYVESTRNSLLSCVCRNLSNIVGIDGRSEFFLCWFAEYLHNRTRIDLASLSLHFSFRFTLEEREKIHRINKEVY